MSLAFPFLRKLDLYNRASRKSSRVSAQMDFGRSSANSKRDSNRVTRRDGSARKRLMKQKTFQKSKDQLEEE